MSIHEQDHTEPKSSGVLLLQSCCMDPSELNAEEVAAFLVDRTIAGFLAIDIGVRAASEL